ncbi:hypothetical protein HYDPIDRAFT_128845 [Hydnomerulius pinastri MD-312]|nr:hypothetical protein HYDPIDRAFT_128845 [Hydnomerulius pinastri MD-312]
MSLRDLGKNDISEETQAFKDKLASQDTENAGLRNRLMKREADLEEIKASLDETLYKLSKEADRVFRLENDLADRVAELKTERMSSRNTELALTSVQEKLKAEERTRKELEAILDTVSQQSQATGAERQVVERDKRALEGRVRELERLVQTHEAQAAVASRIPQKGVRPRSSSVSNFRLPAVEQELSDTKAQLALKEKSLRILEEKFTRAQDDLVKAENARISIDRSSQKRVSELLSTLEGKEEELEALRGGGNSGEREVELLKRIDEDEAKIAALEMLVDESQANRATQATVNKLQSRLKTEIEKLQRSEERQQQLLREKEELLRERDASRREIANGRELLRASECLARDMEAKHVELQVELAALRGQAVSRSEQEGADAMDIDHVLDTSLLTAACSTPHARKQNGVAANPDESALAGYVETLLQAIDRLRNERDDLKRALEFSEIEYRITADGFQARIASLTRQLSEHSDQAPAAPSPPSGHHDDTPRMKHLALCNAAFSVVISNLQNQIESSKGRLSTVGADLASTKTRLGEALDLVERQKQSVGAGEQAHQGLLRKLEALAEELSHSEQQHHRSSLHEAELESTAESLIERANASEAAEKEAQERLALAEDRFAALSKSYEDIESDRNSLCLQVTNLHDDLVRAQDELADVQSRYSALQAQQLSDMSATEVTHTLKDRIQELESRVLRRTEQIGIHQHDIRRLETNLKLQEERIAEMTSELELLGAQKEAMVEDCAEAREARDEAIQKLEAVEEEVERLEEQMEQVKRHREAELAMMTSTMAKLTSEGHQTTANLQQTTARLATLETTNAELTQELGSLRADHQSAGDAAASHSKSLHAYNSIKNAELQGVIVTLAVVHRAWKDTAGRLQASYRNAASVQARLAAVSLDLQRKDASIDNAEEETRVLRQQLGELSAASELVSSTSGESEAQVAKLHDELATLRSRLQEVTSELSNARAAVHEQHAAQKDLQQATLLQRELDELNLRLRDADSLRASLQTTTEELAEARRLLEEAAACHTEAEAELEERIAAMSQRLQDQDVLEKEFANAQARHTGEVARLESELSDTTAKLQASQENFADLEKLHEEVVEEFSKSKEVLERRLAETDERIRGLHNDHQSSLAALEAKYREESDLLASNLEDREHEFDELRHQLQEESESHSRSQEQLRGELKSQEEHLSRAAALESDLRRAIADTRQQLEQAEAESHALQEEKQSLHAQITGLEAEIQRSISLTRYLESQIRESESTCVSLKSSLQESQLKLAQSEKAGKAAELSLALQATQHDKLVSALRREIASLQSGPDLAELEERNQEMDELLRAKTTELEEYDDRILESLKANKKLTAKVDSLTRKVQSLQAKLTSMKSQPQESVPQPVLSPREPSLPPIPPLPSLPVVNTYALHDRMLSGPSTIRRPKTPELHHQPMSIVPPSHTPERNIETYESGNVSSGKKRRAPDDDERDSVPPEGRYSADPRLRNASTPSRLRRTQGPQAGFTPVRGARTILGLPSPGRRATTAVTPANIISDVTNSPRGSSSQGDSQGKKRSWLGKIRGGGVSQSAALANRPRGSHSNAFDGQ